MCRGIHRWVVGRRGVLGRVIDVGRSVVIGPGHVRRRIVIAGYGRGHVIAGSVIVGRVVSVIVGRVVSVIVRRVIATVLGGGTLRRQGGDGDRGQKRKRQNERTHRCILVGFADHAGAVTPQTGRPSWHCQ